MNLYRLVIELNLMEMEILYLKKKLLYVWDFFVILCYILIGKSVCFLGYID